MPTETTISAVVALLRPAVIYLILIPLIGVIVILFTNNNKVTKLLPIIPLKAGLRRNPDTILYNIALFFSLLNLLVSVIM